MAEEHQQIIAPQALFLTEDSAMPNNPNLPVLIYKNVMERQKADKDKKFQQRFEKHGWAGIWKNGIYDYHHFHSNAHEVLGIAAGNVEMRLGGESGKTVKLEAGDLVILPAGTGHKRLSSSEGLLVTGAYPDGQEEYDLCRNKSEIANIMDRLAAVPLPVADPYYGSPGPLLNFWKSSP